MQSPTRQFCLDSGFLQLKDSSRLKDNEPCSEVLSRGLSEPCNLKKCTFRILIVSIRIQDSNTPSSTSHLSQTELWELPKTRHPKLQPEIVDCGDIITAYSPHVGCCQTSQVKASRTFVRVEAEEGGISSFAKSRGREGGGGGGNARWHMAYSATALDDGSAICE